METAKAILDQTKKKWHNMSHLERFGVELAVAGVAFVAYEEWKSHHKKAHSEQTRAEFQAHQVKQIQAQQRFHESATQAIKKQVVDFAPLSQEYGTVPFTKDAVRHAIHVSNTVENFKSVLGTMLKLEEARQRGRMKYLHSNDAISLYCHLMGHLEAVNFSILGPSHNKLGFLHSSDLNTEKYIEVVKLFRLQLFTSMLPDSLLAAMFAQTLICTRTDQHPTSEQTIELYGTHWHHPVPHPRVENTDKPFSTVRTVFLIDDSVSMHSVSQDPTHWTILRTLLGELVPLIRAQDPHGVDLLFLNSPAILAGIKDDAWVHTVMDHVAEREAKGGTHVGKRMREVLDAYNAVLRFDSTVKPLNVVVFTDGDTNDTGLLHKVVVAQIQWIAKMGYAQNQVGVEFVQVGEEEGGMQEFLKLETVVNEHHDKHDRFIVGVSPAVVGRARSAKDVFEVVAKGIERRRALADGGGRVGASRQTQQEQ
ncbi:hypothetical protein HDU98_001384 [Podochytrium sp. JEL0797]|nr:hypothetical protein HDU98_001384 [Podochytrium sp. JEL0797]